MTTDTTRRQYWTYYLTQAIETHRSISIILKDRVHTAVDATTSQPFGIIPVSAIEYLLQQERCGCIQLFVEDVRVAHEVLELRCWTTPSDRLFTFFPDRKLNAKEFLTRLDPALEEVGYAFRSFQDR